MASIVAAHKIRFVLIRHPRKPGKLAAKQQAFATIPRSANTHDGF